MERACTCSAGSDLSLAAMDFPKNKPTQILFDGLQGQWPSDYHSELCECAAIDAKSFQNHRISQ